MAENSKTDELAGAAFIAGLVFGVIGFIVGGTWRDSEAKGDHSYHASRIVSAVGSTVVRAVESPASIDDQTIETIIDGKLVSRTKPANFDAIWEKAK